MPKRSSTQQARSAKPSAEACALSNQSPPEVYAGGTPARSVLPAGTRLSRIHDKCFSATSFNPTLADAHWGGGRFDATAADPFGYLYTASDDACAVAETLLRDLPLNATGTRLLPRRALKNRRISWITPRRDVQLVSLCSGRDLAAVAQDSWLTKCPSQEYGFTRRWASAIRQWAPWAQGFVWPSRREEASRSYIFFGDREMLELEEIQDPVFSPPDGNRLDSGVCLIYLRRILAEYNVTVAR